MTIWIAVAVIIILLLAGYAAFLWGKVFSLHRVKNHQRQQQNALVMENVHTIAMAMEQQQCDLSEGAIRIAVLLDHLDWSKAKVKPNLASEYEGIYMLYEGVRDQPTHQAYKDLPNKERMRFDLLRAQLENQFAEQIERDLKRLRAWSGPQA